MEYRFLFDPSSMRHFPSFVRLVPNIYQPNEQFFESSVQLNLREITQKPIVDCWVSTFCSTITLYLLVENVQQQVDNSHYKIRQVNRDFIKIILNRSKIHAILRKKELSSDSEKCVFENMQFYYYVMRDCNRLLVLSENSTLLMFLSNNSISMFSPQFKKVITWSDSEFVNLCGIIGDSNVMRLNVREQFKLERFDYKQVGNLIFLYLNELTIIVQARNNQFTLFLCRQNLRICDLNSGAGTAIVCLESGELMSYAFELTSLNVPDSHLLEVLFLELFEIGTERKDAAASADSGSFLLKRDAKASYVLRNGSVLRSVWAEPVLNCVNLNIPYEFESVWSMSPSFGFHESQNSVKIAAVSMNQQLSLINTETRAVEKLFDLATRFPGDSVVTLIPNFQGTDSMLVCTNHNIAVCSVTDRTYTAVFSLPEDSIKAVLTMNSLIFILQTNDASLRLLEFVYGSFRELEVPEDVQGCGCLAMLGNKLFTVGNDHFLRCFELDELMFAKSSVAEFSLDNFENVVFNQHKFPDNEVGRLTHSISNLAINIPKVSTGLGSPATGVSAFEFSGQLYLVFISADGCLHLYRYYEDSMVKVTVDCVFAAQGGGSVEVIKQEDFCWIKGGTSSIWKLTMHEGAERVQRVYAGECRSLALLGPMTLGGVVGISLVQMRPAPVGVSAPVQQIEGKVLNVLTLFDWKETVNQTADSLFLLHTVNSTNTESLLVSDLRGNVLQTIPLPQGQTVTCIKDISSTSPDRQTIIFVGIFIKGSSPAERKAKWRTIQFDISRTLSIKVKVNTLADQTAQEPNRSVTNCFNFGAVLFVCLDDKLMRIEANKIVKIYETAFVSVRHVTMSQQLLVLGDYVGSCSCFVWSADVSELIEHSTTKVDEGIKEMALSHQRMRVS